MAPERTASCAPTSNERALMELCRLHGRTITPSDLSQVDGPCSYSVEYHEICSTVFSMVMRAFAVAINVRLAYDYYARGQHEYFLWTTLCIAVPFVVTSLILANMCHQDGKFNRGACRALRTLWIILLSSFFVRYLDSLIYAIRCKRAEERGEKETQLKYYKLAIREESDVAFIRLFECFLEAAPQKILQISIVLGQVDKITNLQTLAICSYFGSMAWCLAAYHRYNRFAQIDKHDISFQGLLLQLCWHFCISVSRTLCIAFVTSLFPFWTLVACLLHALLFGFVTFIVDRPKFAGHSILNFLFCLVLGVVYLFTYISVKDSPTRLKYTLYYTFCSLENVACVVLFVLSASSELASVAFLLYALCAIGIAFYFVGIVFMVIYYLYFHPQITVRKPIVNSN